MKLHSTHKLDDISAVVGIAVYVLFLSCTIIDHLYEQLLKLLFQWSALILESSLSMCSCIFVLKASPVCTLDIVDHGLQIPTAMHMLTLSSDFCGCGMVK